MSAAASPARYPSPVGFSTRWARQGAESFAAAFRIISDLTAQEMALLVGMIRERLNQKTLATAVSLSGQIVEGSAEAGKVVLDLAAGESAVFTQGVKDILGLDPSIGALVDLVPRSAGTIVEMHKSLLDAIVAQTEEAVEAYSEGRPYIPAVGKLSRDAIERFIGTQKVLLDQIAEQVNRASETPKESKAARKTRASAIIQMTRESMEQVIEAQQKIVSLAMARAEQEEIRARVKPPTMTLAGLTRKSVHNLVAAQKSLLDLALKPGASTAPKDPGPAPRRKPRARKKAASAAPTAS